MSEIGIDMIFFIGIAAKSTACFLRCDWKCLVNSIIRLMLFYIVEEVLCITLMRVGKP
jgi:hypothetical protein